MSGIVREQGRRDGQAVAFDAQARGRGVVECELEARVSACVGVERVYPTDAAINTCSFPALSS